MTEAVPQGARPKRGRYVLAGLALAWLVLVIVVSPARLAPVRCGIDHTPDADTLVMLSASWCGYCRRAREYLQANTIRHCEYDVETSTEGRRQFLELSAQVVPAIKIRDDVLYGFNRVEINQTLIAHGLADFPAAE